MDITFHQEMKESLQSQINELSKNKVQKLLSYKQISIYREKLRQLQMKYDDLLKKNKVNLLLFNLRGSNYTN